MRKAAIASRGSGALLPASVNAAPLTKGQVLRKTRSQETHPIAMRAICRGAQAADRRPVALHGRREHFPIRPQAPKL